MGTEKTKKTPEERATEALGVARRAVERWEAKKEAAEAVVREANDELAKAVARLEYVAMHPDLSDDDAAEAKEYLATFAQQGETEPEPVPED